MNEKEENKEKKKAAGWMEGLKGIYSFLCETRRVAF